MTDILEGEFIVKFIKSLLSAMVCGHVDRMPEQLATATVEETGKWEDHIKDGGTR